MATGGVPLEQLSCSICLEVFCSPVTLPCGHCFCRGCIHTYWDKGDISCPLCLTRFPHRPDLSVNVIMEELASGLRVRDEPLVPGPPDCMISQIPKFATEDLQNPMAAKQNKVLCSRHLQEMSIFCVEDNTLLCDKCAAHHKTHKTVPAVEQIPQIKILLRNEKIRTTNMTRNLKVDILKAQMNTEAFKESTKLQQEELEVDFSRLISAITDVKRHLMASMEEKEKRLLQKTQSEVAKMEATCKSLEDKVSNMDASLKSTDPGTIMQAYNSLQKKFPCISNPVPDGVTLDPEEKLTESRDIREQLFTAVTSIWKDQGPKTAKPRLLDIDCTSLIPQLCKLEKYKESLTFDLTTAGCHIWVSPDKTWARNTFPESQPREIHPERLNSNQVRATQSFTGGRHLWKFNFSNYPVYFGIKSNKNSWCVEISRIEPKSKHSETRQFSNKVWFSGTEMKANTIRLGQYTTIQSFGAYLDYDSGILCLYYEQDFPATSGYLHTFTTNFNKQVLHPVFQVDKNAGVRLS